VLGDLAGPGIDAADLYFQGQISESWALEDGIVKEGSFNLDQGVGVRAQSGEKPVLPTATPSPGSPWAAARAARSISRAGQNGTVQAFSTQDVAQLYAPDNPLEVLSRAEKVELLKRIDAATRALDPRIQQVSVSMAGVWERILVASTDGGLAADVRPLVRFNVSVIVEQNGRRERGGHGGGGRTDYRYFLAEDRAMGYAREALRQALVNLEAIPAPAGTLPVVLAPAGPACCCTKRSATVWRAISTARAVRPTAGAWAKWLRPNCAPSSMTAPWRPSWLAERRRRRHADRVHHADRERRAQGLHAGQAQRAPDGRGPYRQRRRESYAHLPMPRMTNTYMLAGESDPAEIIASVKKGIYCANLGGGQVDITSGKFVFSTSEAYLIEDGKITARSRARR
jgi:TldD protein